jgi:hypothetical protein
VFVHRFFGSIRIPLAHRVRDLGMPLEREFLRGVIPLDFAPPLHQPVHYDCMDRVEDRIVQTRKSMR